MTILEEEWKSISEVLEEEQNTSSKDSTKAMISNLGRYKNCYGKVSNPTIRPDGYCRITRKSKHYYVHVLVAKAFIPNDDPLVKTQINHKDGNRSNNCVDNLEYNTRSENIKHSFTTNKERKSGASKRLKPCLGRKVGGDEWIKYLSISDASRKLGIDSGGITSCCKGKQKTSKGYQFKYDEPTEVNV